MSGPGVGFEYPPVEVSWLKRDALLFANTIGATADELHFLYVRRCEPAVLIMTQLTNSFVGASPQVRRLPYVPHYPASVKTISQQPDEPEH